VRLLLIVLAGEFRHASVRFLSFSHPVLPWRLLLAFPAAWLVSGRRLDAFPGCEAPPCGATTTPATPLLPSASGRALPRVSPGRCEGGVLTRLPPGGSPVPRCCDAESAGARPTPAPAGARPAASLSRPA